MKILKGKVDWMEGRGNRPNLSLLVDAIPTLEVMRFDERDNIYFAERDGFCRFFSWRMGSNNSGFGGSAYDITLHDGTARTLRGPWSSSASTANGHGFGPCMDVSVTTDPAAYTRGHTFQHGAVLASLLRDYANVITFGPGFSWRPGSSYAAEVTFPATSRFTLACAGHEVRYSRSGRVSRFWSVPEVLPGGARIENVRAAILAARDANAYEFAQSLAEPYVRYLGADAHDVLLSLTSFEPAVRLPDGTFWVKPE